MRFNANVMIALGCAGLLAMSAPAFGAPKSKEAKAKNAVQRSAKNPAAKNTAKNTVQHAAAAKSKIRNARDERRDERRDNRRDERIVRPVSMPVATRAPAFGSPVLVNEARKYMGTNPTARTRLWCATFMNMVLAKAGYSGTNSDAAKSFAQYGRRISEPRVGAIAVLTRGKNGGHVGVVSGIDANGNPIIISGNHNKRVGEATYSSSRVIAYVMPSENPRNTQLASGSSGKIDLGIDSPISELIAAIEAEGTPTRLPQGAHANARQVSEPSAARPRRQIELDPAIAEFLGIKPRVQTGRVAQPQPQPQPQLLPPPQVRPQPALQPAPQRELRVQQSSSGRVAADVELANRLLPLSR